MKSQVEILLEDMSYNSTFRILEESKDRETLNFSFIPAHDGYLNIFYINPNESLLLYPNQNLNYKILNDIPNRIFTKNEIVNFPINSAIKYTLSVPENLKSEESHLLFVYTKEYLPYTLDLEIPKILEWIYKIPQNKRSIQYFPLTIYN